MAQEGQEGVEHAMYYLSKKFLPYEEKYNLVEKTCLIMIWATRKLKILFSILQNTGCFKDRSIEVFIPSTYFDWKYISVVSTFN